MNLNTIYDWITSLLRTRAVSDHKALEALAPASVAEGSEAATAQSQKHEIVINNVAEFIPTLDFVLKEPEAATYFELRHVATTGTHVDSAAEESQTDDDDKNSIHTYIISRNTTTPPAAETAATSETGTTPLTTTTTESEVEAITDETSTSTDTEELLQQEVILYLSLTDSNTISSFTIDEPTSSITIEMAEQHTTSATISDGALPAITTTTTTTAESMSARRTTPPSSSSSIAEEIEEAIEISEEEVVPSAQNSESSSANVGQIKHNLGAGIHEEDEALSEAAGTQSAKVGNTASDDGRFQIDDSDLYGDKIAQHFVVEDDEDTHEDEAQYHVDDNIDMDEDEDDDDDFDISLPLENVRVHSLHDSADQEHLSQAKRTQTPEASLEESAAPESLSNQSTADDVSDFVEEPPQSANLNSDEQEPSVTQVSSSGQHGLGSLQLSESHVESTEQQQNNSTRSVIGESDGVNKVYGVSKAESIADVASDNNQSAAGTQSENLLVQHSEQDHSLEELFATNASIEIPLEEHNISTSLDQLKIMKERSDRFSARIITDLDADDKQLVEAEIVEIKTLERVETLQLKPSSLEPLELTIIEMDNSDSGDLLNKSISNSVRHSTVLQEIKVAEEVIEDAEEDDDSLKLMKVRLLAMQQTQHETIKLSPTEHMPNMSTNDVRQMERVPLSEYTKDVLEDITEESERCLSLSTAEEQQSLSLEHSDTKTLRKTQEPQPCALDDNSISFVSLNMLKMLEQKVNELQSQLESKNACLASLNLQLEQAQRRESNGAISTTTTDQPGSARDSSSLVTNSTEYRTFQEEFGAPTLDIYVELTKRDELIAKLTDSLQQSLQVREQMQTDSEKLNAEVQVLRRQLLDTMESLKRPSWPRVADQESNCGQRISEISMDLISESDDDLERQFLTDNEEKYSRNSRERQLSFPKQQPSTDDIFSELPVDWVPPFSKQIEVFQQNLTPNEMHLFFMVQKKFDDFLKQELDKCKAKYEQEMKITMDQWETAKQEHSKEVEQFLNTKQAQDARHTKEMEDLRKYFEHKCADLEKQFSDDVFSQKSQHHGGDTSSECSEAEQLPHEMAAVRSHLSSKDASPRKRTRAELLLSPSHRQITPCGMDSLGEDGLKDGNQFSLEVADMKVFYQTKMHELKRAHEEQVRKLTDRLKYYERRYPDDDFMTTKNHKTDNNENNNKTALSTCDKTESASEAVLNVSVAEANAEQPHNTSLIIIDQDELNFNNESQVIQKIIEEYERRLQEQLTLARQDIVDELEQQIQNLLSDATVDDQHWPKELILLREKFTAKSQLEITQLNIKHAEEMSRLKLEYEKQLNRKNKRNLTFDSSRDLVHIINERDGLRELSKSFRNVLTQLAKCVANCEDELNVTLAEELQKLLAFNRSQDEQELDLEQTLSGSLLNASLNASKQMRLVPDVQSLLEVVEDPSLIQFINSKCIDDLNDDFDLNECLDRLKSEASYLLQLSEDLHKQREKQQTLDAHETSSDGLEKHDSCCEAEDGLKLPLPLQYAHKFLRTNSLNEQQLGANQRVTESVGNRQQIQTSLPPDLNRLHGDDSGNASELNFQLVELKNRLIKSETDRQKLQHQLEHTINRNAELGQELQVLRDQFSQLSSLNHTDYAEGYGLGSTLKTPEDNLSNTAGSSASFAQLQEKARNLLSSPTQKREHSDATVLLLQMIEDFCREGDKVVECSKKDREDLQSQIDTADKQLKATRQFLEEQAVEREHERDEFQREIERLKLQLRDLEKERSNYANASEEYAQLESQLRDVSQQLKEATAKRDKFEVELKASIDKIFVLREIISELETQVETKALNEHVLGEKVKQLEEYIGAQTQTNETLQHEVQSLKTEIDESYQARIRTLEEKLQNVRPTAEQSMVLDQMVEQLHSIEQTLDLKTKNLESIHNSTASNSCSLSVTEDVSVHGTQPKTNTATGLLASTQGSPVHPSPRQHSLTMEGVQRVVEKLDKHTRVEEAAIKRIRDLEMQVTQMRAACVELQHERDSLQGRIDEQTQRISTLQSRLEEQRQRAEELHRSGTSDLNIRVHDLQIEVNSLGEQLSSRDKQLGAMKQQLDKSRTEIKNLEAQLRVQQQPDRSVVERLEAEVKQKNAEVQKLKDKIKTEMINRLSLPDLMDTMLADKNDEIDHLRVQLQTKEKELQLALDSSQNSSLGGVDGGKQQETSAKLSARTLSDIVSITEFDEPEAVRRIAMQSMNTPLLVPEGSGGYMQQTMDSSKDVVAVQVRQANTFEHPHYFQDPHVLVTTTQSGVSVTPTLVPRQINFSNLTEDSKLKTPGMLQTPEQLQLQQQQSTDKDSLKKLKDDIEMLRLKLDTMEKEKVILKTTHTKELQSMEEDLVATQLRLGGLQEELEQQKTQIAELTKESVEYSKLKKEFAAITAAYEALQAEELQLQKACTIHQEQFSKQEKNLRNYVENERKYQTRIAALEANILENTVQEANERENLRRELRYVSEAHEQCKHIARDAEQRKHEIEQLNEQIKAKDERILELNAKLTTAEERCMDLQRNIETLEREIERLKQQQSDNSSKVFSVDEIAQQVEKELNYSAQLDSNILKAIESEEENNLDSKHLEKDSKVAKSQEAQGTDDENFTGERDLLNQLEALKAQLCVEREQYEAIRIELHSEKQHSQEIQEQDVLIIEAMRKRLETALENEDDLHKQLDQERDRCERLQTQLTSLQRAESRRNSSLLLKSPTESPRKSPRSLADFESELGERLRGEIKLLTAQNERERERNADMQRNSERERQRYEKELQERIDYCDRLKREMEKLARDKDNAEQELEHLQERLTLQSAEIESLEARLVTLQEAETRRYNRRERQHQESAQLVAELQEQKTKLLAVECERDKLNKKITQLRFDVERGAAREAQLAEALALANEKLSHSTDDSVPQQFLQKMKEINALLAENTQENRQMAETVQFLVGERRMLQKKCEELEAQLASNQNASELEERCRHLLGRYLRVESHRKALVYQKRYLKLSLESYQDGEQRALAALHGTSMLQQPARDKRKLFKTVALAIIAIQRIKYIGRIWHTGKRIVSKSVFTITQQKRTAPSISCPTVSSTAVPAETSHNAAGGITLMPHSPPTLPTVNMSTLHPIPTGYTMQAYEPTTLRTGECTLPSLAKLEWSKTLCNSNKNNNNNNKRISK